MPNNSRSLPMFDEIDLDALRRQLETFGVSRDSISSIFNEMANTSHRISDVAEYLQRRDMVIPILGALEGTQTVTAEIAEETRRCARCHGSIYAGENYLEVNGSPVHLSCFTVNQLVRRPAARNHHHAEICPVCGYAVMDDAHLDLPGGPVHQGCVRYTSRSRRAIICSTCGSLDLDNIMADENGDWLCPSCYGERTAACSECGREHRIVEMRQVHQTSRNFICDECANKYRTCSRCGRMHIPVSTTTQDLCLDCFIRTKPGKPIRNYHCKPAPKFHGKHPHQYGLELEVDGFKGQQFQKLATRLLYQVEKGETSFMLKVDGSLREGHGFEIVFHPRELASWYSYKNIEDITKAVELAGGKSYNTETCGIHVHRGRKDITAYHVVKMTYLLARYRKLTRAVAMRPPVHYAKEPKILKSNGELDPAKLLQIAYEVRQPHEWRKYHCDRYVQLNHINEHTLELRIFRGNLNPQSVLSCILFFDRLVEFTRNQTIKSMEKMSEVDLMKLFNGFCQTMTTKATLGKRSNNAFCRVSKAVTDRLADRINRAITNAERQQNNNR